MENNFTAHNIRLDDGTLTKPEVGYSMEAYPWLVSARRVLETAFPGDKSRFRLVDLGCLEGGFSVEFARMGFQVLGIDVRESNIAVCNYVKSRTNLPNLEFAKDNVYNVASYGKFDIAFCCGLLYHLDTPRQFLEKLSTVTTKMMILQTHFSPGRSALGVSSLLPILTQKALARLVKVRNKFFLSKLSENEGLPGRWYPEPGARAFAEREQSKWASWDNRRSFWIQREYLLQLIQDIGFDLVMEQFDGLDPYIKKTSGLPPSIAESMLRGYYRTDFRGTFIGVKTN